MAGWIHGIFSDRDDALRAMSDLTALGFTKDDISVMLSHSARKRFFGDSQGAGNIEHHALEGTAVGALVGGIAVAVAVGAGAFAGLIAGPIGAIVGGAGAGAAAGGIIGALTAAGLPPDQHQQIDAAVANGDIVIAVNSDDARADRVRAIFDRGEDPA